jgi:hypothetical protein
MVELIPYYCGFVTLLFGFGFYFGLQELKDVTEKKRK